jgi:Flp pilus assembly secretin CpaC
VQTINLVQVVPPRPDLDAAQRALTCALARDHRDAHSAMRASCSRAQYPTEEALAQLGQVIAMFAGRVPIVNLVITVVSARASAASMVAVKIIELNRGEAGRSRRSTGASIQGRPTTTRPTVASRSCSGRCPVWTAGRSCIRFASQIHALVNRQKARILSEPNLLVNEGEEAEILIGGEIPVPIAQAGVGGAASITVEWKPFGVNLQDQADDQPEQRPDKAEVRRRSVRWTSAAA